MFPPLADSAPLSYAPGMGLSPAEIPDHVKRLMAPEVRRAVLGEHAQTTAEAVAVADKVSERQLQDQIAAYLRQRDIEPFYSRMDRRTTNRKGQPDFLFAHRGIPYAWEAKTPIGKLSPEQEAIIPKMLANGWRHAVIRSVVEAKQILDGAA